LWVKLVDVIRSDLPRSAFRNKHNQRNVKPVSFRVHAEYVRGRSVWSLLYDSSGGENAFLAVVARQLVQIRSRVASSFTCIAQNKHCPQLPSEAAVQTNVFILQAKVSRETDAERKFAGRLADNRTQRPRVTLRSTAWHGLFI